MDDKQTNKSLFSTFTKPLLTLLNRIVAAIASNCYTKPNRKSSMQTTFRLIDCRVCIRPAIRTVGYKVQITAGQAGPPAGTIIMHRARLFNRLAK